jgi:HNH endonuclease
MPGYLLNWKRKKDGFVWETIMRDIESTRNGIPVPAKWFVNRQQSIREGDRVFVLAQGGPYLKPPQINGLIAAGYAEPVPAGKMPIQVGHVVYHDEGFRTGNYITAVLNTVLSPEHVLPVSELERTGNLGHVEWKNVQSPGAEIGPRRRLKLNLDVLLELEEVWERHLEKIDFLLRTDPDDQAAIKRFGFEGRVRMQAHKWRERDGALPRQKKAEAMRLHGKLECEVCTFVFTGRYGDHGSEFIECHHREALATLDPNDGKRITLEDLALVCANCHRMLHWKDFPTIGELRSRLRS